MTDFLPQLIDWQRRKDAPHRPLDWRFKRAIELSRLPAKKRYPRPGDDALVLDYADMLFRLQDHSTFTEFDKIRKRHPDLVESYVSYAVMNKSELALMDALLLSQSVDPKAVSRQSGLTEQQQNVYRRMFLDVEGRRDMSIFIASQLMEPARLRSTARECSMTDPPDGLDKPDLNIEYGPLTVGEQCVLRVIGFYSSPVVIELVFTGFLPGTIPAGRGSAERFILQSTLTNVRRNGMLASAHLMRSPEGMMEIFKLAAKLAMEEKEEGQIDIIQNIEAFFGQFRPRIGNASQILNEEKLPQRVLTGAFELTDDEMVEAMHTGQMPKTILALETALPQHETSR